MDSRDGSHLKEATLQRAAVQLGDHSKHCPGKCLTCGPGCTQQNMSETGTEESVSREIQLRDTEGSPTCFLFESGGSCEPWKWVGNLNRCV